jgi:hypothetical protein
MPSFNRLYFLASMTAHLTISTTARSSEGKYKSMYWTCVGFDSIRVFRINRLTINLREINRLIDYNRLILDN